jgi:hypothetical protein
MYRVACVLLLGCAVALPANAQAPGAGTYQPKYAGDKAHSNAEAAALGYVRTVLTAQKLYHQKHNAYATSLAGLVGSGSFTKRMASTDRADYKVGFRGSKDKFDLSMTPKQFDAEHRSFFADETGTIRAEDDKPATSSSPVLK